MFESLSVRIDDQPVNLSGLQNTGNNLSIPLAADGKKHVVAVAYQTRGRDRWCYSPSAAESPEVIRDFSLTATTNFSDIDYPKGTTSPVQPAQISAGVARRSGDTTASGRISRSPSRCPAGPMPGLSRHG